MEDQKLFKIKVAPLNKNNSEISKINSIEDVYAIAGYPLIPFLGNNLSKEEKSCNALMMIFKIAEAYNFLRKECIDWTDNIKNKYVSIYDFPNKRFEYDYFSTYIIIPGDIAFTTSDDLIDAQTKFESVFLDYYMISKEDNG